MIELADTITRVEDFPIQWRCSSELLGTEPCDRCVKDTNHSFEITQVFKDETYMEVCRMCGWEHVRRGEEVG